MTVPSLMAILGPIATGFLFGPWFVGGLLLGATISAIMLAIFCGNAGGAWDNGKKYIETGAIQGQGKGSEAHAAGVIAIPSATRSDTVARPDILIKIMSTVSLITVAVFNRYNLLDWIMSLVK
jgi:K(+)-stimulated pyrophosphate-energized sodium pump